MTLHEINEALSKRVGLQEAEHLARQYQQESLRLWADRGHQDHENWKRKSLLAEHWREAAAKLKAAPDAQ